MTEEIGPKKKVLYIGPSTETPYLKKRFGKRLVMDGESENVTVELKNSTYNDTCTLSLVVLFKDTNDETETIIYSATRIQICGMLTRNSLSCFFFVERNKNVLAVFLLSKFYQKVRERR